MYGVHETDKPSGRGAGDDDHRFGPYSPRDRRRTGPGRCPCVREQLGHVGPGRAGRQL